MIPDCDCIHMIKEDDDIQGCKIQLDGKFLCVYTSRGAKLMCKHYKKNKKSK